jgi:alkanesulfonate monooxygenase SsuD/methylene tetrahydromethanopterin reductase-like flavin-dependent oxidoreductase (luciferase family)
LKVRFGVELPDIGVDYKTIKEIALLCEDLGYDTCLLCDHFYPPEHVGFNRPRVECWTTLSALAGDTERIRLGTFVLSNTFRHPPLLAKMSSTLDVISGGRLELGLGSGFHEPEHKAYGIRFPEPRVRVNRMREAVQIIKRNTHKTV